MAATFGGNPIFGLLTACQATMNPLATQVESFFGVPGTLSKFGGTRGLTIMLEGVLFDSDLASLNADEQNLLSFADGVARTFVDQRGRTFTNVLFNGEYTPRADGPHPTNFGWCLAYSMTLRGLTP